MGGVYPYNQKSYQYLKNLVKENGLENEIEFVVNRTDIPHFLNEADLFVLPSRFEGLGLSALEAMAAGVPVIVSDVDGPRELVQDYKNGYLFESENSYALAEAITHVYYAPTEARRVADEASRFVRQFDISVMARQYQQTYHGLIAGNQADFPCRTALTDSGAGVPRDAAGIINKAESLN